VNMARHIASYIPLFILTVLVFFLCSVNAHVNAAPKPTTGGEDPQAQFNELLQGNVHFRTDNFTLPNITSARRHSLAANGQEPKVAMVGCSDSRVPPEYLFEQGLGDIFLVRLAGNVVDRQALGSLEYAVEHLGVDLIVVLGHHDCGAVKAALDQAKIGQPAQPEEQNSLWAVIDAVLPAAEFAKKMHPTEDDEQLEIAVRQNIQNQCNTIITNSQVIRERVSGGTILIKTAESYLDTGLVQELNITCVVDELTRFPNPAIEGTHSV